METTINISVLSQLIPLSMLYVITQKRIYDDTIRGFCYFILFVSLGQGIDTALRGIPHPLFYRIYTPIEFYLLAKILISWEKETKFKEFYEKWFPFAFCLVLLISLIPINKFDYCATILEGLFLFALAIRMSTVISELTLPFKDVDRDVKKWINKGVTIYFAFNVLTFSMMLVDDGYTAQLTSFYLHALTNTVTNIIYGGALVCYLQKQLAIPVR